MLALDYDRLELKIAAQLAGDPDLISVFNANLDAHRINAAALFGVEVDDVTPEMRTLAKMAVYQMNYGGKPENLWRKLVLDFPSITLEQVEEAHRRWYNAHFPIKVWQDSILKHAQEHDYVEAPLSGNRVYFYGRVEPEKCYNYPIQHTAADIINRAIPKLDEALDWSREAILAQVHDELVICGPDARALATKARRFMEQDITIGEHTLKYNVGIKVGYDWGNLIEVDSEEEIEGALERSKELAEADETLGVV
jgi:DNA polymerase-1